jgi:hypothetical protein
MKGNNRAILVRVVDAFDATAMTYQKRCSFDTNSRRVQVTKFANPENFSWDDRTLD